CRWRGRAPGLRLLLEPEPLLEHAANLLRGRAPESATRLVVFVLDGFPELGHGGVLLFLLGRCSVNRAGADADRLLGGRVRALDPAADLVPVLVEEDDDRDGLIAVVQ